MNIRENLENVELRIKAACERAGRKRDEIELIAVSKTKPVEYIKEAIALGVRSFGENKVQELKEKTERIEDAVKWHLIGHLQTNKVKYAVGRASLIHSLENLRLAEAIEKEAVKRNTSVPVLIEVNQAKEESKFGILPEEVEKFVREVSAYPHIEIKGLMTVAPYTEIPETNRVYFRELRKIMVDLNSKNIDNINMNILSMGMTGDYEVAIEEGATMIRVGTGIFGDRDYPGNK